MLSGTGLSGSDKVDRVSNLLDISREAEVSNKDVEKFGIPQLMHSHEMILLNDLLLTPYIVVDIPWQSMWYQTFQVSQQIPRSSQPTLTSQNPQCESSERESGPGFVSTSHELLINTTKMY